MTRSRHQFMPRLREFLLRCLPRPWKTQPPPLSSLRAAKRFLFLQYETALGSAVHATPMYEALRRAVPDAFVAVACSGFPYEVLRYNPNIDEIYRTPHPLKEWERAVGFFLIQMRKKRHGFDCVLVDAGNRQSKVAAMALASGVRWRIGFATTWDLHHRSIVYDPNKSVLANNLRLIGLLGHDYKEIEPSIFFSESDVQRAREFIREQRISEEKLIVVFQTQTSGGEPNQWYDDRFVQVADKLHEGRKAQIVFVGTDRERGRIDAIRAGMRAPSYSAAGRTDIPELAALLSMCDLLVTLDTGTMHVGRAVGVPMVVIAPAKNPEYEWLPSHNERIRILMRRDIVCAQCRKLSCATRECMDEIGVGEVVEAATRHLAEFPASQVERQKRVSRCLNDRDVVGTPFRSCCL